MFSYKLYEQNKILSSDFFDHILMFLNLIHAVLSFIHLCNETINSSVCDFFITMITIEMTIGVCKILFYISYNGTNRDYYVNIKPTIFLLQTIINVSIALYAVYIYVKHIHNDILSFAYILAYVSIILFKFINVFSKEI